MAHNVGRRPELGEDNSIEEGGGSLLALLFEIGDAVRAKE